MTSRKLRKALKTAKKEGKVGLLVWKDSNVEKHFSVNGPDYDGILSEIHHKKYSDIYVSWRGLVFSAGLAIPVTKAMESNFFFQEVLHYCKYNYFEGPITFI